MEIKPDSRGKNPGGGKMDQSYSLEGTPKCSFLLNEHFQLKNRGMLCSDLAPVAVFVLLQMYRQEGVHSVWVKRCETALVAN